MNGLLNSWERRLLLAALLMVVIFVLAEFAFGQNGGKVMPLVVAGGVITNPGDFAFTAVVLIQSNAQASAEVGLELRGQDGNLVNFGLREVTGGQISSGVLIYSTNSTLSLNPKEQKNFLLAFPSEIPITTFWLNAQVPTGVNVQVQFDLLAMTNTRSIKQFSFIKARPDAVKSTGFTVDGVLLGIPAYNPKNLGQREVVLAMTNPNNSAVAGAVTYRDQNGVDVKSVSYSVPSMGQNRNLLFLTGSAPFLPFEGSATVTASAPIYLGIWSFENEFFTDVKPVPEIFVPNQSPRVNIEVENGRVFTGSPQEIGGWAVDTDGTLTTVQVTIDGGTPLDVPLNINRADVQTAFPGSQLNSGWKTTQTLANGQHTIKVSVTDSRGATAEQTRNFSVNRPAVVPEAGEYRGPIDPATSTPAGVADAQSNFYVRVFKVAGVPPEPDQYFVDRWDALSFVAQCQGGNRRTSWGFITPSSPRQIVDGRFSYESVCGPRIAVFIAPNQIKLESTIDASCMSRGVLLQDIQPCQGVVLKGMASR